MGEFTILASDWLLAFGKILEFISRSLVYYYFEFSFILRFLLGCDALPEGQIDQRETIEYFGVITGSVYACTCYGVRLNQPIMNKFDPLILGVVYMHTQQILWC